MKVGLVKGRHKLPDDVTEYIFTRALTSEEMVDKDWLYLTASNALAKWKPQEVEIYVTGLTSALIAVLNVCRVHRIKVVCVHYDRQTGGWWRQEVM